MFDDFDGYEHDYFDDYEQPDSWFPDDYDTDTDTDTDTDEDTDEDPYDYVREPGEYVDD